MTHNSHKKRGFTLLELLIVIAIIAVLSVILIIVINPAEVLQKARDSQRMSDLNTLKTALGIFLTSTTTPYLAGATSNAACKPITGAWTASDKIYYSLPGSGITDATLDGGAAGAPGIGQVVAASVPLTDGTGWLPVNLDSLIGGSPISNFPIDPVNTIADLANVSSTDKVYRYVCSDSKTFEIDAQLESSAYTADDDKRAKDGGNNSNFYEVGTNLKILGAGSDF